VKRRILRLPFLFLLLCVNFCSAQKQAPSFTLPTLGGGTVSSNSFRGDTVLLQFWATWCPHCKSDQAALDNIASEYASKGLSVVAIDVGESEEEVRQYLQQNPRSATVALDPTHAVFKQFGGGGFPHYILVDRNGNIVGRQNGGGGEDSLRYLLRNAGLTPRNEHVETAARGAAPAAASSGPQLINVPNTPRFSPVKPLPKTIFVLSNGEKLESDHYVIQSGYVDVTVGDQVRHIALSALDTKQTVALNKKNGVDLKLPANKNEVFLGF